MTENSTEPTFLEWLEATIAKLESWDDEEKSE
jgi:hypothetical protein